MSVGTRGSADSLHPLFKTRNREFCYFLPLSDLQLYRLQYFVGNLFLFIVVNGFLQTGVDLLKL